MPTDTQETFSSIECYLRGHFRMLETADSPAFAQITPMHGQGAREKFAATSPFPDTITKFLCQMDEKLDTILSVLHSTAIETDFPHTFEVFSISATQLRGATKLPVAKNDYLEIVVHVPLLSIMAISGIGRITEVQCRHDRQFFTFFFTRIDENDREAIIRFVFHSERKALRQTRID